MVSVGSNIQDHIFRDMLTNVNSFISKENKTNNVLPPPKRVVLTMSVPPQQINIYLVMV